MGEGGFVENGGSVEEESRRERLRLSVGCRLPLRLLAGKVFWWC